MAAHTLTFTIPDLAEKGVAQQLAAENAQRAAQDPPVPALADADAFLVFVLGKTIAKYRETFIAGRLEKVRQALRAATPATTAIVLTTLGLDDEGDPV